MQRKQKKIEEATAAALAEQKAKLKDKVNKTTIVHDGKPKKVDEERLLRLSQPKPIKQPPTQKEIKEQKEKENGEEKAKQIINGVQRGKAVDFMSYLDRDVPAMSDKVKKKLSGPLPEFKKEGESDGGNEIRAASRHSKGGDSTSTNNRGGANDGRADSGA